MITYKGNKLLKGKTFFTESNTKISYVGKVYKDFHLFQENGKDLVLSEQEVDTLRPYFFKEHSLLQEQDNQDELYQLVSTYTDIQLNILDETSGGVSWVKLKDSFQEELNKLSEFGLSYKTSSSKFQGDGKYLLDTVVAYLRGVQKNISDTSLPVHYVQLSNFIFNIDQHLGGDR